MKRLGSAVLAGLLLAGLAFALGRARAAEVSTRELALHRERWLGRRVRVSGTLESFEDPKSGRYFALDDGGFRVGVAGLPQSEASALVGRRATEVGRFRFSDSFGDYVQAERLTPAAGAMPR